MKIFVTLLFFGISTLLFAQNGEVVTMEDGRKVILKSDFTWEYLNKTKTEDTGNCQLPENFEEPRLNPKIQNRLKRGRATIGDIKEKVAKDYGVRVFEVILISASEQQSKGEYLFCVAGKRKAYKRMGTTIIKKGKLF